MDEQGDVIVGAESEAEMVQVQRQALWRLIEFFKTDAVTAGLIGRGVARRRRHFCHWVTAHLAWISSSTSLFLPFDEASPYRASITF